MRDLCPTCLQPLPNAPRGLTARELEVVMAWWTTGSVSQAAIEVGVSQQRAKNMLAAARIRNGVKTNDQLLALNLDSIRAAVKELASHNVDRHEAA